MLTKNFYSYIRAAFQKKSATFTLPDGTTSTTSLNNDKPPFTVMNSWTASATSCGVSFGTGTTPATPSDYCLENILTSAKISVSSQSEVSFSRLDTYEEYSVTFGITNKTDADIVISEVGLTTEPYYLANGNQYTYRYALVDRTVLDTPVTIPAGQSKQITYTIRFNYGDAV